MRLPGISPARFSNNKIMKSELGKTLKMLSIDHRLVNLTCVCTYTENNQGKYRLFNVELTGEYKGITHTETIIGSFSDFDDLKNNYRGYFEMCQCVVHGIKDKVYNFISDFHLN